MRVSIDIASPLLDDRATPAPAAAAMQRDPRIIARRLIVSILAVLPFFGFGSASWSRPGGLAIIRRYVIGADVISPNQGLP
jgi:hypothetical protein